MAGLGPAIHAFDIAALTPRPAFDYAYSWGRQSGDSALVNSAALRAVFAQHNAT